MSTALERYLKKSGLTQQEFADQLGVSHVAVWHWVTGQRVPRAETAVAIERVTEGSVKVADLLRKKSGRRAA